MTARGRRVVQLSRRKRERPYTLPTLLGMLERAGYDLRLEVIERDIHDAFLGEWEQSLDESTRERLRRQGYRLVSDAA